MAFLKKKSGAVPQQIDLSSTVSDESAASLSMENNHGDNELIAVIMASIMNVLNAGSAGGLHIRSIKRIGRNTPIWSTAGRDEYILSKL